MGPTLLLAEGISMYLPADDGVALLQRIVDRFGAGELQIDFYNWLAVRSQYTSPATTVRFDVAVGGQSPRRHSQ